jgi:hypothetical protein
MTSFEWQVPFLVVVIVVAIVYFAGRQSARNDGPPELDSPEPGSLEPPASGAELIERLQRTLGMAIVVDSIEPAHTVEPRGPGGPDQTGERVTMHATFMFGRYSTTVAITSDSESQAWDELGRAAIAWRNSDYQHVPMWWGGV